MTTRVLSYILYFIVSLTSSWKLEQIWEVRREATLNVALVPIRLTADDPFIIAQGKFGLPSTEGDALSETIPPSPSARTLSYRFAKTGSAKLQLLLEESGRFRLLDGVHSDTFGLWHDATTVIPATSDNFRLVFRASSVLDGMDAIAISSVKLSDSENSVLSSMPNGEIRRAPASVCHSIFCTFERSSCQWSFSGLIPEDKKMLNERGISGQMRSEPFLQPLNAHLQLDLMTSEGGILTVEQRNGQDVFPIWSTFGQGTGWNVVNIPLRYSSLPTTLVLASSSLGVIGIRKTNLVDRDGNQLACGGANSPIRSRKDDIIRLTAVQNLEKTTTTKLHTTTVLPTIAPIFTLPGLFGAVLPISPVSVNHGGVGKPNSSPIAHSDKRKPLLQIESARRSNVIDRKSMPVDSISSSKTLYSIPFSISQFTSLPVSMQKMIASKLSQVIDLNSPKDADSRPFNRKNVDFVVQNAFNAFSKNNLS